MSIHEILSAVQNSAVAHAISKTDHMVGAGLQVVHVLGLILFLSSLVLISLRVGGWIFTGQSVSQVARDMSRLMWAGLALTALSGTLMFIATPILYFYNWAFGLKMVLLLIGIIVQVTLFRRVANTDSTNPASARLSVALSVVCWFSVAMAGRMIGFI